MTASLEAVIRALDAGGPDGGPHTSASLAAALRQPIALDDVAPWIRFDPANYVRNLVARGDRWELRLLCWRPGQMTSLHGHGDAACAFRVLRGSATEVTLGTRDRQWAPGDVVVETGTLVHQVGDGGHDALLTLHAYSPALPIDAPSSRDGHHVAVIGGGFGGVAAAYHLLRRGGADLRISLIERGPWLGRGIAYGVDSEVFRLNVPASKMSIDPERRDDFVRWAGVEATPHAFLPRSRYAAYVVQRFGDALRAGAGKLRVIRGEAEAIADDAVGLADGTRIPAAAVVLATGLAPRVVPSMLVADPRIIDAWDECALAALPREGRLLILGAGLTALDVIAFLHLHGYRGAASIVSRRGRCPRAARPAWLPRHAARRRRHRRGAAGAARAAALGPPHRRRHRRARPAVAARDRRAAPPRRAAVARPAARRSRGVRAQRAAVLGRRPPPRSRGRPRAGRDLAARRPARARRPRRRRVLAIT